MERCSLSQDQVWFDLEWNDILVLWNV